MEGLSRAKGEDVPQDVIHVQVHPSVRVIHAGAFLGHRRLMSTKLHDGIEVIEKEAFWNCSSLHEILFPPSVRAIKAHAFWGCSGLTAAILNVGLKVIGGGSFYNCASLVRIDIAPSVRAIKREAFCDCSGLTIVELGKHRHTPCHRGNP